MEKDITKTFQKNLDAILERSLLKLIPYPVSPNALTILRLFLLPVLLFLLWIENYTAAFILFLISAFSDLIDGALARSRNQITEWGTFVDPLADRLLIGLVSLLLLFRLGYIYLTMAIIFIDFVTGIGAIYKKYVQKQPIKANITGKLKFVLQTLGIGGILIYVLTNMPLFLTLGVWLLYSALFFGALSLLVYFRPMADAPKRRNC